jgi:PAS domain S-box-containing protein
MGGGGFKQNLSIAEYGSVCVWFLVHRKKGNPGEDGMSTLSIPVIAMASISLYVGSYHLLIYFRRRQNREDLTFSFLCFAYVFYAAFCAGLYNAESVAEGAGWQRAQFVVLAVFATIFLWFVSDYTHQKPDTPVYLLSIFYLLAIIVQLVDRSNLTFPVDQPSVKHVTLPFVQPITYYEAALGPFSSLQGLMGIVASTYILIMGIRYFRHGYRREASPLILAIGLMYAAGFHDTLVSNGVYDSIYSIEYAYLAVILVMAYSLSNTVVDAAMAKEELRKSEERFRSLVETTSDWVWEVDATGIYTYASPKVRELLGYEPEEIIGRTPFDLMPPEEAKRVGDIFQTAVLDKKPLGRVENITRHKDGRLIVLETSGIPFFDEHGRLSGYRGIDRDITERKRVEEALRESEQKFRLFVEQSSDGLVFTDEHGIVIEWNQAQEQLTGLSRHECIGGPLWDIQHDMGSLVKQMPRQPQELKQKILYALETGQGDFLERLMEIELVRRDGTKVIVQQMTFGIKTNHGYRLGSIIRDVTKLKQVEEELRASEARFRRLVEASPIPMWTNTNGIITYVNSAALRALGTTQPDQVLGRPATDFIHPDYHALVQERVLQMVEAETSAPPMEEKYIRLDGSLIDVEVIATPFVTSEGTLIQVFFQDITHRKQAEQSLQESEERLRQIASSLRETIWLRDIQTRQVLYVNPAFEQLTGWTCESFYEKPDIVMNAIHPEDKEWVSRALAQRVEGVPYNKEHRIIRLDGSVRWVASRSFPVRNEAGEVYRWATIMEDITERKQADTERERLITELENKNAELERFTYTVSHDLKAPLITIRGFLGFIEKDVYAGDMNRLKEDIQRISAATDKMQRLLSELLELSRIGRLTNPLENIAFGDLVHEVIKLLEERLRERKIEVKIQDDLPIVCGDSQRLSEVVQNLLDNAVKFMGAQANPVIEIGTQGEESSMPVFYIRDNGMGIAPEHHDRIFGLFNKLDPRAEGTGVGLAIVKRIIEVHGGRIWVESAPGKGTTFYFTVGKGTPGPGEATATFSKA